MDSTPDVKENKIEICIQGGRNCISVGKGIVQALGFPEYVAVKVSDQYDDIIFTGCEEKEVMSFRVPDKLFMDHHCVFRIYSKQFVHELMTIHGLDITRSYNYFGEFCKDKNFAIFHLGEGAKIRAEIKRNEEKQQEV